MNVAAATDRYCDLNAITPATYPGRFSGIGDGGQPWVGKWRWRPATETKASVWISRYVAPRCVKPRACSPGLTNPVRSLRGDTVRMPAELGAHVVARGSNVAPGECVGVVAAAPPHRAP
jgi:hypothetical protein